MKAYFLNKQNNQNLIVFFAGWSFDYYPFINLEHKDYDILFIYDYNDLSVPEELTGIAHYQNKILITWSMGVFAAFLLKDLFTDFNYKLAINGTVNPVDNENGIPVKMFELTLKHAAKGLEEKFYQNVFLNEEEYNLYKQNPVHRSIENRVTELENLYNLIKTTEINYNKFYDSAIVSDYDKIIPPQNQIESHKKNNIPVIILPFGHYPFYNYSSWNEIIKCKQTTNI